MVGLNRTPMFIPLQKGAHRERPGAKYSLCEAYQRRAVPSHQRESLQSSGGVSGDSSPSHHPLHLLRAGPSSLRARHAPDRRCGFPFNAHQGDGKGEKGPLHPLRSGAARQAQRVGKGAWRISEPGPSLPAGKREASHGVISAAYGEALCREGRDRRPHQSQNAPPHPRNPFTGGRRRSLHPQKDSWPSQPLIHADLHPHCPGRFQPRPSPLSLLRLPRPVGLVRNSAGITAHRPAKAGISYTSTFLLFCTTLS